MPEDRAHAPRTTVVTAGRPPRVPGAPLNTPIELASTYVAGGEVEYGRVGNTSWTAFEDALGALEGGRALAFASGMAAVSTVLDLVAVGDLVVVPQHAYQGSLQRLDDLEARGRLRVRRVDVEDTAAAAEACADAALVWLESPTNPALEVADLPRLIEAAHAAGAWVAVDNTFATPLLQRPLEQRADLVVHSATKLIAGHSDLLMGAVVTRDDELYEALAHARTLAGGVPGAVEAYLALRGMRTLALRVERAGSNAADLVQRMGAHPAVSRVRYPGFGSIVAIELHDGADAADRVVAATRLWIPATSLGGVESTLERRRRYATEAASIDESLIRLSVGIEDVEDLWADLAQALDHAADGGAATR
ncbi:cystathionine gamma-synthase [Marmoricola endophyticus]|uniref:homocysteine desulfhydrase n=1 Tax=Marmoricola endophyticus TaxID=2040280 RepID=A0A917BHE8_9ACTN|nr:PLP-dependent aspartate aminotransferase family protein [Marmoricola endophyticus]GGF39222.1 cystathionine gamma-synthase [Marmoricola endophyticus]